MTSLHELSLQILQYKIILFPSEQKKVLVHLHNCHFTSIFISKIQKYYFLSLGGVNNKITFLASFALVL